jgi:hypothetical protein
MLLSTSIFHLYQSDINSMELMRASRTLRIFGWYHERLYQLKGMTYNVHQVTEHLSTAVCHFGPLTNLSSDVFENEHRRLSGRCHGTQQLHMQFSRVLERKMCLRVKREAIRPDLLNLISNRHNKLEVDGCVLHEMKRTDGDGRRHFTHVTSQDNLTLTTEDYGRSVKRDSSYVITKDHQFLVIQDIVTVEHRPTVELVCAKLVVELFTPYDPALRLCNINNCLGVEHILKCTNRDPVLVDVSPHQVMHSCATIQQDGFTYLVIVPFIQCGSS